MSKSLKIRILSLIICVLMLVTTLPVSAIGNSAVIVEELTTPTYHSYSNYVNLQNLGINPDEFIAFLSKELWNYEEKIDISKYRIPYSEDNKELLSEVLYLEMPENFHVNLWFEYNYTQILSIVPVYTLTRDEYIVALGKVQATKNEILEGIRGNKSLTEAQKALLIHDRLALTCEYDFDALSHPSTPGNIYNLYGTLVEGKAVCQGYAIAYDYILEEIGIESYICTSNVLNHAWNIITVDGIPYHVDVTWDDLNWSNYTTAGVKGGISHDNFLKSTAGIRRTGHEAYDFDSYPSDTRYDNNQVWQNSETAFQLIGNEIYYFDNEARAIKRLSDNKVLKSVPDEWQFAQYNFASKVALASDGKDLFYSTPTAIHKLDIKNLTSCAVFVPTLSNNYSIYGFQYKDGYFVYDINCLCPGYPSALAYLYEGNQLYDPNLKHHVYSNDCDDTCNSCGQKREALHKYSSATCTKPKTCKYCGTTIGKALNHSYTNECDVYCNRCDAKRTPPHVYTNSCDKKCNKCQKSRTIKHTYTNSCDTVCDICSAVRTIEHKYKNSCDTSCDVCNKKRTIKHSYSSSCDTSCNVCKAKRSVTHSYKTVRTKATLTKNGSVRYKCSKCDYYASKSEVIKYPKTIKLSETSYTYTGGVKTPTVTVKDSSGKKLKKNTDYSVTYQSGRKNVGKYKVTITFKGKYSGKKILYFTINPKAASVKSLSAKSKALSVKINRSLKQSTGYQIQYSSSKTFKNAKTLTVSSYKKSTATITKLKSKTTYYVRIRTYKTVSGKKYYSNWSSYKSKKTK